MHSIEYSNVRFATILHIYLFTYLILFLERDEDFCKRWSVRNFEYPNSIDMNIKQNL